MLFTLKNYFFISLLTHTRILTKFPVNWKKKKVKFSEKNITTLICTLQAEQIKVMEHCQMTFFSFFTVRMGFSTDLGRKKATNEPNECQNSDMKAKGPKLQCMNCTTTEDVPARVSL